MSQMQLPVLQLSKTIFFRTFSKRFFASSQHLKSNQYEELYNNKKLKFQCEYFHQFSDKETLYNSDFIKETTNIPAPTTTHSSIHLLFNFTFVL